MQPGEFLAFGRTQPTVATADVAIGLLTQCRIDQDVQPNSFASSSKPRPARYGSTIWRRNSGAHTRCDFAILDTSL